MGHDGVNTGRLTPFILSTCSGSGDTLCSLTSGLNKKDMEAMSSTDGFYRNAKLDLQYFCVEATSSTDGFYRNAKLDLQCFGDRMIASVNIACATRHDVDKREEMRS